MGLAQALEETTRYESQMFFTDSENADVGLTLIFWWYKMFHWSWRKWENHPHISFWWLSAGCYGSCVFGRDSGCVFRCLRKGLVHSLHDCTAAICNGGSKSYYLQLFLVTFLALDNTVTCVIIWLYIRDHDTNLKELRVQYEFKINWHHWYNVDYHKNEWMN